MKLLVVEDHAMFREFAVAVCRAIGVFTEIREASSCAEAAREFEALGPKVVLLDVALPDGDGLDLAERFLAARSDVRILALSSSIDEVTLTRVLESGLFGFVDKNSQGTVTLREALAAVAAGRIYYTGIVNEVRQTMRFDPFAFTKLLTDKERELMPLFGAGFTNEEIAQRTGVLTSTVHSHRKSIMRKVGVHTTPQLMLYALKKGFTRVPDPKAR